MDNPILSPDIIATDIATTFEPEFGSPPLFINPFTSQTTSTTIPSRHACEYLDHLHTLGFSEAEQGIIIKLNLDWILCHIKWPAFHWDIGALESSVRDWVGSGRGSGGFGADLLHLESRTSVRDLKGEILVGPMDFSSRWNSAPGPPIANDLDNLSDGDIVNDGTADDAKGEDALRCGTPDFQFLQSFPSSNTSPNGSPNPIKISLPLSHSGSGGSSDYSESASGLDLDGHLEFRIEETEVRNMIGPSLVTFLDSNEFDAAQMQMTEGLGVDSNDERSAVPVIHGTSAQEDESVTTRSDSSNPDVFYKTPIDPIKLSKLTQLSTIPVAGDPSLLHFLSTLAVPPFPESQTDALIPPTHTQIQTQLQIFKKDAELCTKSQIMDAQGTIANEVGAQLRCGCDECRPVAMKALFGDCDWVLF